MHKGKIVDLTERLRAKILTFILKPKFYSIDPYCYSINCMQISELWQAKWLFIINPAAANGRAEKIWEKIKQQIEVEFPNFAATRTAYAGHAIQLAKEAISAGCRHLVAVGGDGTNHEVINGILEQKEVSPNEILYTLLPLGTGNDWIRTYNIPKQIVQWIAMVKTGHLFHQDVGLVKYLGPDGQKKSRYFVNVAGMAYDAFVVQYSNNHRSWLRNHFSYLLLILSCLFKYQLTKGILKTNTILVNQFFYTINIGICRYSGGGMQLVPHAVSDDGFLALTYAGPISKLGVILNTWRFYNASIGRHPKIQTSQVKKVEVSVEKGEPPILLEADGEFGDQSG